ncbi:hypothetical protein EDD18DRAFT_1108494 [Armillaria luteobubalina]|uniref:Uncharacterized protein n=1 Tax=Armillaria luteobubalina TaxID=153913 RepID=A0AA39PYE3_9AGAR|nr:hypothetical protein EDD18DRAFT_1108494 [Armillaria luteobubalina]
MKRAVMRLPWMLSRVSRIIVRPVLPALPASSVHALESAIYSRWLVGFIQRFWDGRVESFLVVLGRHTRMASFIILRVMTNLLQPGSSPVRVLAATLDDVSEYAHNLQYNTLAPWSAASQFEGVQGVSKNTPGKKGVYRTLTSSYEPRRLRNRHSLSTDSVYDIHGLLGGGASGASVVIRHTCYWFFLEYLMLFKLHGCKLWYSPPVLRYEGFVEAINAEAKAQSVIAEG